MEGRLKKIPEGFVSYRFAAIVIASLFFASLAGWIAQELVPPDFVERRALYDASWRPGAARIVDLLDLHDPFRSLWYRFVLALFFAVLVACNVSRFRRIALRSLRAELPAGAEELRKRPLFFDLSWRSLTAGVKGAADPLVRYGERHGRRESVDPAALERLFARLEVLLKRRGLRVACARGGDAVRFTATSGRLRSPGTMLFHLGIAVITVGGLVGSLLGWRGMVYLKEGETAPLPPDSAAALRVDDFRIVTAGGGEIRDYISTVTILGERGETLAAGTIEVNRPFRHGGVNIYQSSYTMSEGEFARARISYRLRGEIGRRTAEMTSGSAAVLGDSAAVVSALRFLPDFRMGSQGAFSASPFPANPALEVEVSSSGEVRRGWLFLRHPDFNSRFGAGVDLALEGVEPVYYTGLEFASNPGVPVLFAGFAAATLGLLFMYLCNPRIIKGIATREGLLMAGVEGRWKASFAREFEEIRETIQREFDEGG